MDNRPLDIAIASALRCGIDGRMPSGDLRAMGILLLSAYDLLASSYAFPAGALPNAGRHEVAARLGAVYGECATRVSSGNAATAMSLLPLMYSIAGLPLVAADMGKYRQCDGLASALLEGAAWPLGVGQSRVALSLTRHLDACDRRNDRHYARLQRQVGAWARAMSPDGSWSDAGVSEAIGRLDIMNAITLGSTAASHGDQVRRGYGHYRHSATTAGDMRLVVTLAATQEMPPDRELISTAMAFAGGRLQAMPVGSPCTWETAALLLDCLFYTYWS